MKSIYRLKKHKNGLVAQQQEALVRFRGSGANLNLALGFDAKVFTCIMFQGGHLHKMMRADAETEDIWLWALLTPVPSKGNIEGNFATPTELLEHTFQENPEADIWFCRTDKEFQTIIKSKSDLLETPFEEPKPKTKAPIKKETKEEVKEEISGPDYTEADTPEEAAHN